MAKRMGIVKEFFLFCRENKSYWLLPIVIVLLLFAVLMVLSTSSIGAFVYTLF